MLSSALALLYKLTFCFIEKDIEVNRNNKKLLEKLVEISKGKHVSFLTFTC